MGLSLRSVDNQKSTILHYATYSGSTEMLLFIRRLIRDLKLKIEPTKCNDLGQNAFWVVNQIKNANEMRKILNLSEERLGPSIEMKEVLPNKKAEKKENVQTRKQNCLIL